MTEEPSTPSLKSQILVLTTFLREEGYAYSINHHGSVILRNDDKNYCVEFDDEDKTYLTLAAYNIVDDLPALPTRRVLKLAARLTMEAKVAKLLVRSGPAVDALAETRFALMEHFTPLLSITLEGIDFVVDEFRQRWMKALEEGREPHLRREGHDAPSSESHSSAAA